MTPVQDRVGRPGQRTQHTIPVTLSLTDASYDTAYGTVTLQTAISVLWGYDTFSIAGNYYEPGKPDEVSFIRLRWLVPPSPVEEAMKAAVRSYVENNAEQCVRLVEEQ